MATYTRGGHIFEEISTREKAAVDYFAGYKRSRQDQNPVCRLRRSDFYRLRLSFKRIKAAAAGFQMITGITARPLPAADIYLFPEICYETAKNSRCGNFPFRQNNETVRAMQTLQNTRD
jgi:hypothetical protein